jgi:hypothetical protein
VKLFSRVTIEIFGAALMNLSLNCLADVRIRLPMRFSRKPRIRIEKKYRLKNK